MKLTVGAYLAIKELCKDKDFSNFPDLITGDDWVDGAIKAAVILSGEPENVFLDKTPGELVEIRNSMFSVIEEGFKTNIEVEKDKKKEEPETSA